MTSNSSPATNILENGIKDMETLNDEEIAEKYFDSFRELINSEDKELILYFIKNLRDDYYDKNGKRYEEGKRPSQTNFFINWIDQSNASKSQFIKFNQNLTWYESINPSKSRARGLMQKAMGPYFDDGLY